jgi:uncharacterized protein
MPLRNCVGAVAAGDDFFDREDLIEHLWHMLPSHSVELVAPRRFGKTSVMRRLVDEPRRDCQMHFVDCETFADPDAFVRTVSDLLLAGNAGAQTAHTIDRARGGIGGFLAGLRGLRLGPVEVSREGSQAGHSDWSGSIPRLLSAVRSRSAPTIVILDEFSMMLDHFVRTRIPHAHIIDALTWLRRLRQEQGTPPVLAFVVGGSMNLEHWLRHLRATALLNDLAREEVRPFDPPTALAFVDALLLAEGLSFVPSARETILQHVEPAVPFWLQVLVWLLVQEPGTTRAITANDVAEAYSSRLIGTVGRHYFEPFVERLRRDDESHVIAARRILTDLALAPPIGIDVVHLSARFTQVTGDYAEESFQALFADLQSEFYVRYDDTTGRCVFAHKVLRDWWVRWQTGAGVARNRDKDLSNG